MSYIPSVKKRDGRISPFNKKSIVNSILEASRPLGGKNKKLARNLAQEVEDYLREVYLEGETLLTDNIARAVQMVAERSGNRAVEQLYSAHRKSKLEAPRIIKVVTRKKRNLDTTDLSLMVVAESQSELIQWDREQIIIALTREAEISPDIAARIAHKVERRLLKSNLQQVPTGFIRELVDIELLDLGYGTRIRQQSNLGVPIYDLEKMIFNKNQENSNLAANNPEAVNLAIAEITMKQYALRHVFSRPVSQAHLSGRIHLHDLGYPIRVYCGSHSLEYLKKFGLKLDNLDVASAPPRHARSLTGQLNTFLASMQSFYAGALGIGFINIAYAPYLVGFSKEDMRQEAQQLIYSLAQSAFSRGGQALFLDANIHTGIPVHLKDVPAIGPGGKETGKTYGEYKKESRQFARALMDVWRAGDAFGHVFTFPKMDFHINAETFSDPEQYELLQYACRIASENGTPYFIFDRDEITLSACCRLRTKITDDYMIRHPESMRFCGFQNVTINLPQAAYRARRRASGDPDEEWGIFIEEVEESMDLAMRAHLEKKRFISRMMEGPGRPLWQIGKPAADGRPYVDLEAATYIIGIIGLNECVQFLTGKELHEGDEIFRLGIKIVSRMYMKTRQLKQETGLIVTMEESPAESAARRLAKVDLREYPESVNVVKGSLDRDESYYTNSIHYAAAAPISLIERIDGQSRFHTMIESGAIIHAFVGESQPSPEAILSLVTKTWENTRAAQLTISPEFTICEDCGKVTRGLQTSCGACHSENVYGLSRVVGYFSRIDNWNLSKHGELADRQAGKYSPVEKQSIETVNGE
ncbi:MAG: anaerobic ribonucleoside-triphosphate reductase [Candidatus Auribacterota bacterium]|nr:anaerobic ribonucleoside-triphosphate reductase [Candidatus Auribacterota bacterium]